MARRGIIAAVAAAGALVAGPVSGASILLLPAPGTMEGATLFVTPNDPDPDTILVCESRSQLAAGTCAVHRSKKRVSR